MNSEGIPKCLREYVVEGQVLHPLFRANRWEIRCRERLLSKLAAKQAEVATALAEGNWRQYLASHEPSYRILALLEIKHLLEPKVMFEVAGEIWNSAELIQSVANILVVFQALGEDMASHMMTPEEAAVKVNLEQEFYVYRSHNEYNKAGVCWTLNEKIALDFALQFDYEYLSKAKIDRDSVSCIFTRRKEDEVILSPSVLTNLTPAETRLVGG